MTQRGGGRGENSAGSGIPTAVGASYKGLDGVGVPREPSGEDGTWFAHRDAEVGLKLTKLGESDDIEAF